MKTSVWKFIRFSIFLATLWGESRAEAADWTVDSHGTLRFSQAAQWSDPGSVPNRYGEEVSDRDVFPLAVAVFPDTEVGIDEADSPGYLSLPEEVKSWLQRLGVIAPEGQFTRKLSVTYTVHRPCGNETAVWWSTRRSLSSAAVKLLPLSGGQISFKRSLDQGTEISMVSFPNGFFLRRLWLNSSDSAWWETEIADRDTAQALTFDVFIVTRKRIIIHIEIIPSENMGTDHAAVEDFLNSHQEFSDALTRLSSWTVTPTPQPTVDFRSRQLSQLRANIDTLLTNNGDILGERAGIEISPKLLDKYRHYDEGEALPHTEGRFRIALISPHCKQDIGFLKRIAQAAENLGWEWIICTYVRQDPRQEEERGNKKDFLKTFNPHCAIHFTPQKDWYLKRTQNFLYCHAPGHLPETMDASRYDGFLVAMPMEKTDKLRRLMADSGKKFFAIPNHQSVCRTLFSNTPKTKLFYCGVNWDDRKKGNYLKFWKKLGDTGYFEAYGPSHAWDFISPNAYKGWLQGDRTVDKARECGIALVLHGEAHLKTSCTSARPFEAAAGSAILICDKHAFIQQHFRDSVLYVDMTKSVDEAIETINKHMRWIRDNPTEAQELARRSHQIFCEKFALEDLTRDILDLYESVTQGRAVPGSKVASD